MNSYDMEELENKIKELKHYKKMLKEKGGKVEDAVPLANIVENEDVKYKERLEDVSERVKDIINEVTEKGDLRFAQFKGNIGGKRNKYECPHCKGDIVIAGVKHRKSLEKQPLTGGRKDWMDYVDVVANIPEYHGLGRRKIMTIASKLRKEGHDINKLKRLINK